MCSFLLFILFLYLYIYIFLYYFYLFCMRYFCSLHCSSSAWSNRRDGFSVHCDDVRILWQLQPLRICDSKQSHTSHTETEYKCLVLQRVINCFKGLRNWTRTSQDWKPCTVEMWDFQKVRNIVDSVFLTSVCQLTQKVICQLIWKKYFPSMR